MDKKKTVDTIKFHFKAASSHAREAQKIAKKAGDKQGEREAQEVIDAADKADKRFDNM